jgi:predicted Zn finger-like uncharacterized protein
MSLATRCTSCGTAFRVVEDQLKVSEGWVRCGRCDAVFNAGEALIDLERNAPADAAPSGPDSHLAANAAVSEAAPAEAPYESASPIPLAPEPDDAVERQTESEDTQVRSSAQGNPHEPDRELASPDEPTFAPNFLREASRHSAWSGTPQGRFAMRLAAALLVMGLFAQAAHQFRNALSTSSPLARAVLTTWCHAVRCTVGAALKIEDVAVESAALTRVSNSDSFKLAVVLRNRGKMAVALPSLDLSLTDSNGQILARRVLGSVDFRIGNAAMAPGAESALQLTLSPVDLQIAGYTIEIFYP